MTDLVSRHGLPAVLGALALIAALGSGFRREGAVAQTHDVPRRGGLFMPSEGRINVLFVYLQFPDDNFDAQNPAWPKGRAPAYMAATVDSLWTGHPTSGGFTDYFSQMSLGKLVITGNSVSMVTSHTRSWYLLNGKKKDFIHAEVLQALDSALDFSPYDHWTTRAAFSHENVPDGVVDMVFMMWRNIDADTAGAGVKERLGLVPGGEATLGYGGTLSVDGGERRIAMGYGAGGGSGVTVINPVGDIGPLTLWRYARHEFGHWLLGDNGFHTMLGTWGLLDGLGAPGDCANAFERDRLGWIDLKTIDDTTGSYTLALHLPDFVTTGVAYRLLAPGGGPDNAFLIENHQRLSLFDVPDQTAGAKGLYILRQTTPYGGSVGVLSAEGRFQWSVVRMDSNIYGRRPPLLPVFLKGFPDRDHGFSKRESIPWIFHGQTGVPAIHYLYNPRTGEVRRSPPTLFSGDGRDAFDLGYNAVLSPYSNPSTYAGVQTRKQFALELLDLTNGVYTVRLFMNRVQDASPSKPQALEAVWTPRGDRVRLHWFRNLEPNLVSYEVWRCIDVQSGGSSRWERVATTADTSWTDHPAVTSDARTHELSYRVRCKDDGQRFSVFSDPVFIDTGGKGKGG